MIRIKHSLSDKIFYAVSAVVLFLITIIFIYPLIVVLSSSFSSGSAVLAGKVVLWPVNFSLDGYEAVFKNRNIIGAYRNTIIYTVVGTLINISMMMIAAYPLSRKDLKGRGVIMFVFTFTMFFNGGLVPFYLLMVKIGLIDNIGAMVVPGALSVWSVIIARTFIQSSIPAELLQAAQIDGCSDAKYFFGIVLPLSGAIIAVNTLFFAVGHWNAYFNAMIYLNSYSKMPLQIILREILIMNRVDLEMFNLGDRLINSEEFQKINGLAEVLKYSLIVVATAPILFIYPFVQKYFIKGVMIGSLKG